MWLINNYRIMDIDNGINLERVAYYQMNVIRNDMRQFLTICPEPAGQISNWFSIKEGYILKVS